MSRWIRALDGLPLTDEARSAILGQTGIMGRTLAGVIAYERGDWDKAHCPGVDDTQLAGIYLDAVVASDEMWARVSG